MLFANWDVSYEDRLSYRPVRRVRFSKQPGRWLHSALRSAGDFLWGAFQPIRQAV